MTALPVSKSLIMYVLPGTGTLSMPLSFAVKVAQETEASSSIVWVGVLTVLDVLDIVILLVLLVIGDCRGGKSHRRKTCLVYE